MQFMNVTLFKQSSLSNIASNHKINPGKNLAEQRTKKFKPICEAEFGI